MQISIEFVLFLYISRKAVGAMILKNESEPLFPASQPSASGTMDTPVSGEQAAAIEQPIFANDSLQSPYPIPCERQPQRADVSFDSFAVFESACNTQA